MARDGTLVALQQLDVQVMIIMIIIIMMTICWQQCQPSWYWWLLMMVILSCESVISFWTRSTALSRVWPAEDFLRFLESSTSLSQHLMWFTIINHENNNNHNNINFAKQTYSEVLKIIVVRTSVTIRDIFIVLVRPLSLVHCFDNILLMLKRLSQETLPFYIPLQVWKKQCLTYQLSQMNRKNDLSESLWPYYSVLPTSIYFSKVGIHIKLRDGLH